MKLAETLNASKESLQVTEELPNISLITTTLSDGCPSLINAELRIANKKEYIYF